MKKEDMIMKKALRKLQQDMNINDIKMSNIFLLLQELLLIHEEDLTKDCYDVEEINQFITKFIQILEHK